MKRRFKLWVPLLILAGTSPVFAQANGEMLINFTSAQTTTVCAECTKEEIPLSATMRPYRLIIPGIDNEAKFVRLVRRWPYVVDSEAVVISFDVYPMVGSATGKMCLNVCAAAVRDGQVETDAIFTCQLLIPVTLPTTQYEKKIVGYIELTPVDTTGTACDAVNCTESTLLIDVYRTLTLADCDGSAHNEDDVAFGHMSVLFKPVP